MPSAAAPRSPEFSPSSSGPASRRRREGQYFGRNQVKYDSFKFEVLQTEHRHPLLPAGCVPRRPPPGWRSGGTTGLSTVLRHELNGRQPVLYATAPEFQQTNVVSGISEGTGGVTEALRRRIVLPIGGTFATTSTTCSATSWCTPSSTTSREAAAPTPTARCRGHRPPLWFIEGMAEYLSLGSNAPTAMWMGRHGRHAAFLSGPPRPALLPLPLRAGAAGLRRGTWGDPIMGDLLRAAGRSRNISGSRRCWR